VLAVSEARSVEFVGGRRVVSSAPRIRRAARVQLPSGYSGASI